MEKLGQLCQWERTERESTQGIVTRSKRKVSAALALPSGLLVETFLAPASLSLAETVW